MANRTAKKVLLIGWDAADWKVITPLMDAGKMPALEKLVHRGVMGNISTLDPPLSPMLWTSIATGKTADQHGVLGFIQPDDSGTSVRPVLGTSRQAKAVWNILNQHGLRSNVVGWWPSHPAEPLNGVTVSDFFHRAPAKLNEPWTVAQDAVHPKELSNVLASLRIRPHELTDSHLRPFMPLVNQIDTSKDAGVGLVAKTIAEAATIQSVATWVLEQTDWDFSAIYFDAIDHFGHGFMKYHPPQQPGISDQLFEYYQGVVNAGYQFHDMMLERLVELAGPDATVILVSDHGFHSDHLRPVELPQEPAAPALEHRDYGVFVMAGDGIKKDELVFGTSLLDITPTILTLFGLPIGKDMPGKPVVTAFEETPNPDYIESWESVDGDDGSHPPESRRDPWAEEEALRQLVELGYIEPGQGADKVRKTTLESKFYLARVFLSTGRPHKALPLLVEAFEADPQAERYGLRLVEAQRRLGQHEAAHETLDRVLEGRTAALKTRLERIEKAIAVDENEANVDEQDRPNALFPREERVERLRKRKNKLESRLDGIPPGFHFHRGLLLLAEGKAEDAITEFEKAETNLDRFPLLSLRLGEAYLILKKWPEAEQRLRNVLEIDPDLPEAHRGLALACLRQDRLEEAADSALKAVGLKHFFPSAHFHLGEAFMRMGMNDRAAQAFEVALSQEPGLRLAHVYLAELYRMHLKEPAKASKHLALATATDSLQEIGPPLNK